MQLHTPRHLPLSSNLGKIVDVATSGTACLILNGMKNQSSKYIPFEKSINNFSV
jgi:hypothetical protein